MRPSNLDKWIKTICKRIEDLEEKKKKAIKDGRSSDAREIDRIIKTNKEMLGKK